MKSSPRVVPPSWIGDLSVVALLGILCIPSTAVAIEPIGTIGRPYPEAHAFLSNEALLRAVPTHIQIVHARTGEVIDEFGKRSDSSTVAFSPTAEHAVILNHPPDSKATTVHVWDVKARRQISHWEIPTWIGVSALSPAEPLFADSFNDEIHLWNWQTGEFVGKMQGERRPWKRSARGDGGITHTRFPGDHAMVFTPDGRYLIVASKRPDIELWNVETRRLEGHFEGHTSDWVEGVVISPNGTRIASFGYGAKFAYVWDVETRQMLWRKRDGFGAVSDLAFSPDSQRLYVANKTGVLRAQGPPPPPSKPCWEGWDDRVRVREVKSGQLIDVFSTKFHELNAIRLSPDEKIALLHYWDAVVLWDIDAKQPLNVWADFPSGIANLSPDGQTVVSVSRYFIKSWDVASQQMRLLISAHGGLFREFAVSPDGKKLAVGRDPSIEVYNLDTGKIKTRFPYHGHSDIAFSATGKWVAAQGDRGSIHLFDIENPEKIPTDVRDDGYRGTWKRGITFSENDQYLAAIDSDERVLLWERERDAFVLKLVWRAPAPFRIYDASFVFRKDGSVVLAAPRQEHVQIWKLMPDSPQLEATLDAESPVHFSPDGRHLYANKNNLLKIWEGQTYTPIEHPSMPGFFAISQRGAVLLSFNESAGRIEVWDGRALLPVESRDKQIVEWGQVKQNRLLQNVTV